MAAIVAELVAFGTAAVRIHFDAAQVAVNSWLLVSCDLVSKPEQRSIPTIAPGPSDVITCSHGAITLLVGTPSGARTV
jgi:hypothetical protein